MERLLWIIGIVAAISLERLSFRGARSASPESTVLRVKQELRLSKVGRSVARRLRTRRGVA